jgi:hypothetical protein
MRWALLMLLIVSAMAVYAQPYPNSGNHSVCLGSTEPYGVINTLGSTYAWSIIPIAGGNGTITGTGSSISILWTNAGTCTLQVIETNAAGCVGPPVTIMVTIHPTPDVIATPASQTICSNGITGIALTGSVPGTTFSWVFAVSPAGSVTGATPGSGNAIAQPLINTTPNPATVTYTITPSANGCPGIPIPVVVTVNPTPNVIATPAGQTICSAGTTGISLTSTTTGTTFSWTALVSPAGSVTGAFASSGNTIAQTLTNTTAAPSTVTYTIIPVANGCPGLPLNVQITVNPTPDVLATPSSQAICSNGTTGITLSSSTALTTFSWTTAISPAGSVTGAFNGSGNSITQVLVNPTNTPATVTYAITPVANGCTGVPVNVVVTVNPLPIPTLAGPTPVCLNSSGNVYTTEAGMTNYNWTVLGGTITGGAGSNSVTVTWNVIGLQSVSVTYTDLNGCNPAGPTVFPVTVNPLPLPVISGPAPVCVTSTNNVYTTQSGMTNYSWTLTGGTITAGSNTNSITVTWNTVGMQSITVTYRDPNGCDPAVPSSYPVLVNPLPSTSPIFHN